MSKSLVGSGKLPIMVSGRYSEAVPNTAIKEMWIPSTLTGTGENVFAGTSLTDIYHNGKRAEFTEMTDDEAMLTLENTSGDLVRIKESELLKGDIDGDQIINIAEADLQYRRSAS